GNSRLGSLSARAIDRHLVHVVTKKAAARIGHRNRDDTLSGATPDFSRFTSGEQALMNIRDRRNPLLSDPGLVSGMKEPLDRFDDIAAKIGERNAVAVLERLRQLRELAKTGDCVLKSSAHEEGVILAREHHRLLAVQSKRRIGRVVIKVTGRRHSRGPFADIAFAQPGSFGELRRGHRGTIGQGFENPEAVTDVREGDRQGGAKIDPNLTGQRCGFFSIWCAFIHSIATLAIGAARRQKAWMTTHEERMA